MSLEMIFSFLTYPKKSNPNSPLAPGTEIPVQVESKLSLMLDGIYRSAERDCIVPIVFRADGGVQESPLRTELVALVEDASLATATPIALRLQRSTPGTSGMGLLFICIGEEDNTTRIVISRFPADEGVVAERSGEALSVQFIEQVFLKSAYSYKAATYTSNGLPDQLWQGHVIDRQLNNGSKDVADYWIRDFLMSELSTTAAAGTKRLAIALRDAALSSSDVGLKQEIASAAHLAGNITQRAMTIRGFCDSFNFSDETIEAVVSKVKPPRLVNESFRFDSAEFRKHLAFRQIELNNGAVLTAPAERFDQVFRETTERGQNTYTTTGMVVDERLRRRSK